MYYNTNKYANDYYNSYKQEMQEIEINRRKRSQQKTKVIIFTIITVAISFLTLFYLYTLFDSSLKVKSESINAHTIAKEEVPPIITEEDLPQSPQIQALAQLSQEQQRATNSLSIERRDSTSSLTVAPQSSKINPKDIALIVQIIMSQMNANPEVSEEVSQKTSLEKELIQVEKEEFTSKSLKESNHYNKVVIASKVPQDESLEESKLTEFTNELNTLLNEPLQEEVADNYANSIKKEVVTRTNEMRVIIVQKGDTLSRIAKKAYGSYDAYKKIFLANPEIIKNPNQIFVGQRLRIPS